MCVCVCVCVLVRYWEEGSAVWCCVLSQLPAPPYGSGCRVRVLMPYLLTTPGFCGGWGLSDVLSAVKRPLLMVISLSLPLSLYPSCVITSSIAAKFGGSQFLVIASSLFWSAGQNCLCLWVFGETPSFFAHVRILPLLLHNCCYCLKTVSVNGIVIFSVLQLIFGAMATRQWYQLIRTGR